MDSAAILLIIPAAFIGAIVGAVAGFGTGIIMLPVLVLSFGIHESIPILTVSMMLTNASRAFFNRKEIKLSVVLFFSIGAVPAALIGGVIFSHSPDSALVRILGVYFLLVVIYRHLSWISISQARLWHFIPVGAGTSIVSAVVGVSGPLMAPFFLSYGLLKGAYIGTDALATVAMQGSRLGVFSGLELVSYKILFIGTIIGTITFTGTYVGKRLLNYIPERYFSHIIEVTLIAYGILFLIKG